MNRPQRKTRVLETQLEVYGEQLAIREALYDVVQELVKVYARAGVSAQLMLDANKLLSEVEAPAEIEAA